MAESSTAMVAQPNISELEEAIYAQQQLLQKVNTELEVEREAAASAASEALSMILRLQGEKASLKMETNQYKRMAEEKMCHAEEALAVFEDLIYQREMEIASLEFQVQAYRYRLLSMGFNDLGVHEIKYPEHLLMQRNDTLFLEKGNIRKLNSFPLLAVKDPNQKKPETDRRILIPMADSLPSSSEEQTIQEINDSEKKLRSCVSVDINSCWDQIKKLDERVKELSDNKDSRRNKQALWKGGSWSPSLFSQVSIGKCIEAATLEGNNVFSEQDKHPDHSREVEDAVNAASSSNVQNIFEVPHTAESRKTTPKDYNKLTKKCGNRPGKPDPLTDDTHESANMHETDRIKTRLLSAASQEKKLPKRRNIERCVSPVLQALSPPELNQLSHRIERLERSRNHTRYEISAGEEELNLLKEIREQLKSIESEMKSWRAKKSIFPLEPSLDPLQEAMLYFWM